MFKKLFESLLQNQLENVILVHIVPLKLVSSSFNAVNLSLDGSRKISKKSDNVETEPSTLDNYAMRNALVGYCNEISK